MMEPLLAEDIIEDAKRNAEIQARQEGILDILEDRFGPEAKGLEIELKAVTYERPRELVTFSIRCSSLAEFRERLLS